MSSREKFLQRMTLSRYIFLFFTSMLFFSVRFLDAKSPLSFTLQRFEKNQTVVDSEIELYGDAEIRDSSVVSASGRIMYKKPIRFLGTSPGFSTYFSFSISISKGNGETIGFVMIPSKVSPSISSAVLKVILGNHVAIEVGRGISIKTSNLSPLDLVINSGEKLHSWIDYNGVSKRVHVRLSRSSDSRPSSSLISYPVDLSNVLWRDEMLVGIISSSSRKNSTQITSLYTWSFVVKHGIPYTMHSDPLDPNSFSVKSDEETPVQGRKSNPWKIVVALVIGAVFGALVASLVFFLRSKAVERHPVAPVEYPEQPSETGCEKIVGGGDKVGDTTAKAMA